MDAELEQVTSTLGAGGMLLVPPREPDIHADLLPEDHQVIMQVVARAAEPVKAGEVSVALGKGTLPGQVEAVRAKLKRLAERGQEPAELLSRHGARCRCCHRSVSPCRSPNPACGSHRTGLSTVSAVQAWSSVQGLGIVLPRYR
ncbi:hypothetical protein [Streptomyces mirabilis]|uniref:hypothetical protein n=1 Tax=Streptomyces mirabilis TaxID=68239 RepID=UPI0031BA3C9C